jgi:hypothetical protein
MHHADLRQASALSASFAGAPCAGCRF